MDSPLIYTTHGAMTPADMAEVRADYDLDLCVCDTTDHRHHCGEHDCCPEDCVPPVVCDWCYGSSIVADGHLYDTRCGACQGLGVVEATDDDA